MAKHIHEATSESNLFANMVVENIVFVNTCIMFKKKNVCVCVCVCVLRGRASACLLCMHVHVCVFVCVCVVYVVRCAEWCSVWWCGGVVV